jgi:hypothetical protein
MRNPFKRKKPDLIPPLEEKFFKAMMAYNGEEEGIKFLKAVTPQLTDEKRFTFLKEALDSGTLNTIKAVYDIEIPGDRYKQPGNDQLKALITERFPNFFARTKVKKLGGTCAESQESSSSVYWLCSVLSSSASQPLSQCSDSVHSSSSQSYGSYSNVNRSRSSSQEYSL